MAPRIHSGDYAIARPCKYSDLKIGDIVIFCHNYTTFPIIHEIIWGRSGKWVTRGINNKRDDKGYLTERNFIAKVEFIGTPK